jgi:hypothetical protein
MRLQTLPAACALAGALLCLAAARGAGTEAPGGQALAQQLDSRYPAGTIVTTQIAERALQDATQVHDRLQAEFDAEKRRCEDVFFEVHCMFVARDAQRKGERIVNRVTLEAHDLRRHADARQHEASRAEELQRQAVQELQRPAHEQQALTDTLGREKDAAQRAADEIKGAETARKAQADTEHKQQTQEADQAHKEEQRPAQEQTAEEAYRKKVEEAAEYDKSKAEDKKVNEQKRAERQVERDKQNKIDEAQQKARTAPQ